MLKLLRSLTLLLGGLMLATTAAQAQYFGKNTVRYEDFDYQVLRTEHFDIYYYEDGAEHIELIGQLAERWYDRLTSLFDHDLTRRQPLIFYASGPHFRQTNTTPGSIGEGTGGFTEIFRNRVVMPYAGTLAETDHILGHELVHAFQFDLTGRRADPDRFGNIPGAIRMPLWLVEGMAEYLSIGAEDSQTTMWLRDMVVQDQRIDRRRLNHPRFQPYRQGHALIAYIGGRFGDEAVGRLLVEAAAGGNVAAAFNYALNINVDDLLEDWQSEMQAHYGPMIEAAQTPDEVGRTLEDARGRRDQPNLHLGPALSPDGSRLIYLSQRSRLSLDLYLMDVESGEVIRRITRSAIDPHMEALQFVRSAGDWSPDSERFVYASIRRGRPALQIMDGHSGRVQDEFGFDELGEIFNPVWAPDGRRIAFSGMRQGFTDLYVFDTETGELERLTDDLYAALHPAWSPDGTQIAYITDRFNDFDRTIENNEVDNDGIPLRGKPRLALMNMDSRDIQALPTTHGAKQTNPNWSADGQSLYFLSDLRGTNNIYRIHLEDREIVELTNVQTGISGLTQLSPALSVAGPDDTMAFTLFDRAGYRLMLTENATELAGTRVSDIDYDPLWARLPPVERPESKIADYLEQPHWLQLPEPAFERHAYRPQLRPEFMSQISIAAGSGSFGTFAGGGISMFWSDMLGNHNMLTQLELAYVDGELVNNSALLVGYQNRASRLNWGASVSQVPFISGRFTSGINQDGNLEFRSERFWEINRSLGGGIAYPFNRATRLELETGVRHISFEGEVRREEFEFFGFDPIGRPIIGDRIGSGTSSLAAPDSLMLGTTSTAFVYDTSVFGGTGPVMGQRARVALTGVYGDLQFNEPLIDLRTYHMPFENFPIVFAGRVMHFGRYGGDAEDSRLGRIFLGNPSLIRGYEASFNLFADPRFDRLQGSRIAALNLEARVPLFGPIGMIGGFGLPLDLNVFFDGGAAWDRGNRPQFFGSDRTSVTSHGIGIRTNLGGIVLALHYVNPVDLENRDWHWQFTLTPGF